MNTTSNKDYGTNCIKAYQDMCTGDEKHHWVFEKELGKCYKLFKCSLCGALHRIDASD